MDFREIFCPNVSEKKITTFTCEERDKVLSSLGDLLVIVGEVVDVKEVVSMVVRDENVLNLLLRLLENVIDPSENKTMINNSYVKY